VREFLELGYRARVVCVNARWLDQSFAGREFDSAFVADLPPNVDRCGENGEFHTFVFAGPRFRGPVEHRVADVVRHEAKHPLGDATYYFAVLDS
jgi:diphthamide synthase (EF-2-diphthine--ammonia ligase)